VLACEICVRTVRSGPRFQRVGADGWSAAAAPSVRRGSAAKPLAELDFGMDADDADGADGCAPAFSGAELLGVVGMLMVRVPARPSRPKPGRPITTTSARAPRRFEAVPVHFVRAAKRTAAAQDASDRQRGDAIISGSSTLSYYLILPDHDAAARFSWAQVEVAPRRYLHQCRAARIVSAT
jgi:hypothetical protein